LDAGIGLLGFAPPPPRESMRAAHFLSCQAGEMSDVNAFMQDAAQ
jgi:hypothetical protein